MTTPNQTQTWATETQASAGLRQTGSRGRSNSLKAHDDLSDSVEGSLVPNKTQQHFREKNVVLRDCL